MTTEERKAKLAAVKSGSVQQHGEAARRETVPQGTGGQAAPGEADGWRLPTVPLPYTKELCEPPGVVGIMSRYITETARCPRPCLSLAASIALCGTLFGRWYVTEESSGNKTNFYITAVVESSGGKDHPQKVIKNLLLKCDAVDLVESRVTSGAAIEQAMKGGWGVKLFLVDECGAFLKGASAANKNGAKGQDTILECLKELFSSANSFYKSQGYADRDSRPSFILVQPQANFYGSTTPDAFAAGISPKEIEGGWTGRNLVFMDDRFVRGVSKPTTPYPEQLLAAILRFKPAKVGGTGADIMGNAATPGGEQPFPWEFDTETEHKKEQKTDAVAMEWAARPEPKTVYFRPDAKKVYRRFEDQMDDLRESLTNRRDPYRAIWGKVAENAKKLGLLYAASRSAEDGSEPSIDSTAAAWACRLAYTCAANLYLFASEHGGESEYAELKTWVYREIKATGTQGITPRELSRKRQGMKLDDRNEVLRDLTEAGLVLNDDGESEGNSSGNPGRHKGPRYVAACWTDGSANLGKVFCPDVVRQNAFCHGQKAEREG